MSHLVSPPVSRPRILQVNLVDGHQGSRLRSLPANRRANPAVIPVERLPLIHLVSHLVSPVETPPQSLLDNPA